MACKIRDAGQEMAEINIMAKILGSLPSEYSGLVTAWDSVPTEAQTVEILLERLIKEENKMASEDDGGTSRHITHIREWFTDFKPRSGETVSLGNDGKCEIRGESTMIIDRLINNKWGKRKIENVVFVPSIRKNIFTKGQITHAVGHKRGNDIYSMFFKVLVPSTSYEANATVSSLASGMKV